MPFLSKDWRSPGEKWVKTQQGWEKKKVLECIKINTGEEEFLEEVHGNENNLVESILHSDEYENDRAMDSPENRNRIDIFSIAPVQPHCYITLKSTKEIAGFTGLSDAFKRLDFSSAVHDVRRFNYVCKLLDLLITYKLPHLSGCSQKVLFKVLEEVAQQVLTSQQNIHLLNKLLDQLRVIVDCACWGHPLGSTQLWETHLSKINRIIEMVDAIEIRQPGDDSFPKLQNLPEECVREVMLRLNDHKDLEASSEAYNVMAKIYDEKRLWRELCKFHFTKDQIDFACNSDYAHINWQATYHKLRKKFGLREEYAEIILLCRKCKCLFWKSIGHPCIVELHGHQRGRRNNDKKTFHVPVPPQVFLSFFSL